MRKYLIVFMCLFFLIGCASSRTHGTDYQHPRVVALKIEEQCMKEKGYHWIRTSDPTKDFIYWGPQYFGPSSIPSGYWNREPIEISQPQKDYSECRFLRTDRDWSKHKEWYWYGK